jgi:hypothetical protein
MNFLDLVRDSGIIPEVSNSEGRAPRVKSLSVNSMETLCGRGRLVQREEKAMSLRGMECSSRLAE